MHRCMRGFQGSKGTDRDSGDVFSSARIIVLLCSTPTVSSGRVWPVWGWRNQCSCTSDEITEISDWIMSWYKDWRQRMFHNFPPQQQHHCPASCVPVILWCECDVSQILLWFLFHNWLVWRNVIICYRYTLLPLYTCCSQGGNCDFICLIVACCVEL